MKQIWCGMMVSEIENYLYRIEDQRRLVSDLLSAIPTEVLDWQPTPATDGHASNSIAVLVAHIAGAEHFWIAEVIGKFPATRDRKKEFATSALKTAELKSLLEQVASETRNVLTNLTDQNLAETRTVDGYVIAVRWPLLHVVEHTALHFGHMQLTYQLWSGGKSIPSPAWYQRLPATP